MSENYDTAGFEDLKDPIPKGELQFLVQFSFG